ncbi:uncharacterized protein LOC112178309 [Rosa chinensis]|uniref:uncharacterized protein LOC112178309 n=1 Tax=Rosa chinensis TaxID=74649 RepID=UPI000D0885BB|nr:uncharacterized protein LOC112178309 [Rosa chinensis]
MEGAIIARTSFDSKTVAFPIYSHTTYKDICEEICSRFGGGDAELSYAFEGYSACLLQTDMDVQMMYLSLSSANISSVDINVNLSMVSHGENCGNIAHKSPYLSLEPDTPDDVNHHFGKFATPTGKKYLSSDWKNYIMCVGQKFEGGVNDFREKLAKYAIEKGFRYKCVKNEPSRVTAVCHKRNSEGCLWNVHATLNRTNDFFYIRQLNNEHTCNGHIRDSSSPLMGSKIVSSVLANQVRSSPLLRPVDIVRDFKMNYGLEISYYNAWKGKEMAKKGVHGDEALSYKHMEWYVNELVKTNPGSYANLECDADHRFVRMFISFQGCIEGFINSSKFHFKNFGFSSSRPLIGSMNRVRSQNQNYKEINKDNKPKQHWNPLNHICNNIIDQDQTKN